MIVTQWAKSPKKQSVGVYELIKTHSFRLFYGDFAHWVILENLTIIFQ